MRDEEAVLIGPAKAANGSNVEVRCALGYTSTKMSRKPVKQGQQTEEKMATDPTISVIMPTYNEIDGIEEAVRSILTQTYVDFELVIVDGGSTDGTVERISKFKDDRILLLREEEPRGISHALNWGIEQSSGDYIARMDADDRSLSHRFECQVDILESHPEIELVASWYRVIGRDGNEITVHDVDESRTYTVDDLVTNGPEFAHGSVMLRRTTVDAVGGYRGQYDTAEDLDLWLRLSEHFGGDSFYIIPKVLYEHRLSADQMARRERQRVVEMRSKAAAVNRQREQEKRPRSRVGEKDIPPVKSFSPSKREAMYLYLVGVAHLRAQESAKARTAFVQAIRQHPTSVHPWYKLGLSILPRKLRARTRAMVQRALERM